MVEQKKVIEFCTCGFTKDSHNGVLTLEKLQAAVDSLKRMGPPDYTPGAYRECCGNYRRDNLKYLEEVSNAR